MITLFVQTCGMGKLFSILLVVPLSIPFLLRIVGLILRANDLKTDVFALFYTWLMMLQIHFLTCLHIHPRFRALRESFLLRRAEFSFWLWPFLKIFQVHQPCPAKISFSCQSLDQRLACSFGVSKFLLKDLKV